MKIVRALPILLLLIGLKWVADTTLVFLNNECYQEGIFESLFTKLLVVLKIKNPAVPAWWAPLCGLISIQGYFDPAFAMLTLAWYLYAFLQLKQGKEKTLRRGYSKVLSLRGKKGKRKRISEWHEVLPKKRPCWNNNNINFCKALFPRPPVIDGKIFIKHVNSRRERLHQILLGPVGRTFDAIRLALAATFQTLKIPASALAWSSRVDTHGNPEFLGVRSQDIRVDVLLDPRQGINIDVQRLGPARGRLREVAYWCYQLTYRGVVCTEQGTNVLYGSRWDP